MSSRESAKTALKSHGPSWTRHAFRLCCSVRPVVWRGLTRQVAAREGMNDTMTFATDSSGTDGIYVWWSDADAYTVELLAEEKTLAWGESYEYRFTVTAGK